MPPSRPSFGGAQSAKDAALQAEFNEKKWVWVPDDKEGYLAGWVANEDGEEGDVVLASGGDLRRIPLMMLSKMNPPKFDRVDDIADLTFLNEASVVHNLRLRYGSGAIYVRLPGSNEFRRLTPHATFRLIPDSSWSPLIHTPTFPCIRTPLLYNIAASDGTRTHRIFLLLPKGHGLACKKSERTRVCSSRTVVGFASGTG
ncbi:hypothetical protein M407DRAFT_66421 [Tulasnella calospora MUT 4182]|uniref:Myosin N-terminal SH3-like domain-containing protein n=1 Tax=Tulasnella calospora MUT 4182 TaxID=1051891 RepID=A0A0C3QTW1_9AGAM|nr:hypothetical protein M407DRAFT_66421 [Tulasnella calospora MUT 4182]